MIFGKNNSAFLNNDVSFCAFFSMDIFSEKVNLLRNFSTFIDKKIENKRELGFLNPNSVVGYDII